MEHDDRDMASSTSRFKKISDQLRMMIVTQKVNGPGISRVAIAGKEEQERKETQVHVSSLTFQK